MNDKLVEDLKAELAVQSANVGIFVDFDNIYYSLKDYGIDLEDEQYCVFTLLDRIYTTDKIRTLKSYADYEQIEISFKYLQERRVQIQQVYGNGLEEEHRKNASDIELSLDAFDLLYTFPEIDTFVFVTSDSDMIPVMSRMMFRGKRVHLYYMEEHTSQYQNIRGACHVKYDLLCLLGIDRKQKQPEFWAEKAVLEIGDWYRLQKNPNTLLGGRWMNQLFRERFSMSRKAASQLITYLLDSQQIFEVTNEYGTTGYQIMT